MTQVKQLDIHNAQQIRQFLGLPFQIYRETPQWVPPLVFEARKPFSTKKHVFYTHGEAAFFLAFNQVDQAVGRLAVLNNHKYNRHNQEKTAFFYLFETQPDPEIASALFSAAFDWARTRGLNRIIGPKGFAVFDGIGLLTRGFEHRPAFGLPYNQPYYPQLLESLGFEPVRELVSGYLDEKIQFPSRLLELSDRIMKRRGLQVTSFSTRREVRALLPHLKNLYNHILTETSGNAPLSDAEVASLADQLEWFADPKIIKFVMKGGEPVGFLFAYPDISAAVQRTRGRIFPFGWFHLWRELQRTRWININGAGILPEYRGLGGTAILFSEMYKSVVQTRYRFADLVQIGLENDQMLRELRDLGIDFYKQHTLYQRDL